MKTKLTIVILSLATSGLISFAQQNNPTPADPALSQPAPADSKPAPPKLADPKVPDQPVNATPTNNGSPGAPEKGVYIGPATAGQVTSTPAQPAGAQATNATAGAASTNAVPAGAEGGPSGDVVPLIVIEDVPLTDAIRNLARQSNLNFQFDPRLTATNQPNVSIRFENVTASEALNAVLENYNLALIRDPKSKIARITVRDPKAEDPLVSRIIQLKYSDPTNIVALLKGTLTPRSTVVADTRTSQLIVNTTEKELDNLNSVVARLDTPTKQVLIEAKLIETRANPSTIKGIDWTGTLEAQHFTFGNNALPGVPPTPAVPPIVSATGAVVPAQPATAGTVGGILSDPKLLANTAKGFDPATAFLNADGVSAVLSFINKDADSQVVATPRAVTLDNQPAQLSVTRAFPIFLITPGSANSPAGSTINYTNLGTILNVTPRIAADKNISMRIIPEVSNIDSVDRQVINGQLNTANIYAIRRVETRVMIPSGNTLVMGGMLNDATAKDYTKVPILGDIPILGWAFRSEGKKRDKSNLLIFITPTIVETEDYHPTTSGGDFLKTRFSERTDEMDSVWDSAKPKDWTKQTY